jgi:hypothetical protein
MTPSRWRRAGFALLAGTAAWQAAAVPAQAVPSFARQTGQDCAACHVGGFGPQLTPAGIRFKIGGYVDSDGQGGKVPLSGMLVGSYTHTAKAQDEPPAEGAKTNNNRALDEASLFVAGRLADQLGAFVQMTYDGIEKRSALDHADLRFAHATQWQGKDLVLGVSVNNNPTVQDPFNSSPVWSFPYTSSALGFSGAPVGTLVNGGLEHRVLGASGYAFFDNRWYAELGTYRTLSRTLQTRTGQGTDEDPGRLGGGTAYWRLAYFQDLKSSAFNVGLFGFNASVQPDRTPGTPSNRFTDLGIDGQYQWLGTREHIVTLQGSHLREHQRRDALLAAGEADNGVGHLRESKLNVSYHFRQTWGVTAGLFRTGGDADATLYGGSPDTRGRIVQLDWTPFGKEDSWGAPWANLRLGLQYTAYSRYNGASSNYDGAGRNASDNNTWFLFAWTSF